MQMTFNFQTASFQNDKGAIQNTPNTGYQIQVGVDKSKYTTINLVDSNLGAVMYLYNQIVAENGNKKRIRNQVTGKIIARHISRKVGQ
jgi:hypothetical protein